MRQGDDLEISPVKLATVMTVGIFIIQGRLRMIIIIIIITYVLSQNPSICLDVEIFILTLVRNIIPIVWVISKLWGELQVGNQWPTWIGIINQRIRSICRLWGNEDQGQGMGFCPYHNLVCMPDDVW